MERELLERRKEDDGWRMVPSDETWVKLKERLAAAERAVEASWCTLRLLNPMFVESDVVISNERLELIAAPYPADQQPLEMTYMARELLELRTKYANIILHLEEMTGILDAAEKVITYWRNDQHHEACEALEAYDKVVTDETP